MTAYYFRVVEEGKPNGWVGFAIGPTLQHLFWAIDEFVDPYSVEIKTAKIAGYCYHMKVDGDDVESTKHEFSEHEPFFDEDKWRKPIWVTDKNFDAIKMTFQLIFNVEGDPVGKQRPRFARGRTYTPQKTVDYEKQIADKAREAMGPVDPIETPVAVYIYINHAIPASYSKKRREACLNRLERPKKPDLDNTAKAFLDAMNGIVYKDDVQVVSLHVTKRYDTVASVHVCVREELE